ncbi:MAG: Zn-ribbon domain-containing OB-fold protein [Candidatus Bathyarchaeota archaeon]|nr:Zn-ribbon domain-containing OB-fold protein [Candidatus Bathyarchaeota archaeon]
MDETIREAEGAPFTTEQFYNFIEEKKLMATKCKQCGSMFVPPRPMCTNCFSKELGWVQLKPKGKLVTYTVIYIAPEQFQPIAPYAYGIVELEDGLRLPGIIRDLDHEKLMVGIELEVDFETNVSPSWPQWPRYFFKPP